MTRFLITFLLAFQLRADEVRLIWNISTNPPLYYIVSTLSHNEYTFVGITTNTTRYIRLTSADTNVNVMVIAVYPTNITFSRLTYIR